jgi:hypothetical protein
MKQFLVKLSIPATVTKTLTVEAEDEKQATARALQFLSADGEEHILNSEEESNWSDNDFEFRRVTEVKELDEKGMPKN